MFNPFLKNEHFNVIRSKYNLVEPSREMLQKVLKLDRVHTFGNLSKVQIFEKFHWLTHKARVIDQKNARLKSTKHCTLITIISLDHAGLLGED